MNTLDLAKQDSKLELKARTHGGEYAGPCPLCGGTDRFLVWPELDGGKKCMESDVRGKWTCRQCQSGRRADALDYLKKVRGMGFREGCKALGIELDKSTGRGGATSTTTTEPGWRPWTPSPPEPLPCPEWTHAAETFVRETRKAMGEPGAAKAREWLRRRGLNDATIARLGWNPTDRWEAREKWGLPPEVHPKTGRPVNLPVPAGIVIPSETTDGRVHRVRVRVSRNSRMKGKYRCLSGGDNRPLILPGGPFGWAVVESELDAYLVHQEAAELVGVVAMGSTTTKPDSELWETLRNAETVLLCFDADEAGINAATNDAWGKLPNAELWPVPVGKDPGEAVQRGVDIRQWIEAGLDDDEPSRGCDNCGRLDPDGPDPARGPWCSETGQPIGETVSCSEWISSTGFEKNRPRETP